MAFFPSVWSGFSGAKEPSTSGGGTAWPDGKWNSRGLAITGFHQVSRIHLRKKSAGTPAKPRRESQRLEAMAGFAAYIARMFHGPVPSRFASTGRMRLPSGLRQCDVG